MKKVHASFLYASLLATSAIFPMGTATTVRSFAGQASAAEIPSLDQLAADWMDVKTLGNLPAVYNYWGGLLSTPNLTAFTCLAFPPYSQGGELGVLMVDGTPLATAYSRWYPYQLLRHTVRDGVTIESTIRLPFEQQGVFCRLKLSNGTGTSRSLNLGLIFRGQVRQFADATWAWAPPWPADNEFEVSASPERQSLTIKDRLSPAAMVFCFGRAPERLRAEGGKGTAEWHITLAPGTTVMIEYAAAIARDVKIAAESATRWTNTFDTSFAQAKARWEERWQAVFVPGNKHFSGHLPTLVTSDAKIRRVYYHGALMTQLLCRTNLPLSNRVFVTGGPRYSLTVTYFWNTMHLDGHKFPTRHCYDYIVVGQALENELTSKTKREMTAFVENELRTKTWMRAMSLKDPAAGKSDRPDHGPLGSYDGWPPLVMDVMCRFGAFDRAVDFLRSAEAVTHEGPFAQGHEFVGRNQRGYDPIVRIACRGLQDTNAICGAAFMEVIIGSFFGYRPDLPGESLKLLAPGTPRGFTGELRHVPYHGEHYTLVSGEHGISKVAERSK